MYILLYLQFHFLYFLSFAVILGGLAVYSIKPVTTRARNTDSPTAEEEGTQICRDHVNSAVSAESGKGDSITVGNTTSVNLDEKCNGNVPKSKAVT